MIAGLLGSGNTVCVGPPLFPSAPRFALVLLMSCVVVPLIVAPLVLPIRL